MDSKHNVVLNKQDADIEQRISEIKQVILEQKKIHGDVCCWARVCIQI